MRGGGRGWGNAKHCVDVEAHGTQKQNLGFANVERLSFPRKRLCSRAWNLYPAINGVPLTRRV